MHQRPGRLVLHWRNDAVHGGITTFGKHQTKFLWGDAAFLNSFILNDSCNTLKPDRTTSVGWYCVSTLSIIFQGAVYPVISIPQLSAHTTESDLVVNLL